MSNYRTLITQSQIGNRKSAIGNRQFLRSVVPSDVVLNAAAGEGDLLRRRHLGKIGRTV
jgi:hypothetical protein